MHNNDPKGPPWILLLALFAVFGGILIGVNLLVFFLFPGVIGIQVIGSVTALILILVSFWHFGLREKSVHTKDPDKYVKKLHKKTKEPVLAYNKPHRKFFRFIKSVLPWLIVASLIYGSVTNRLVFQATFAALGLAAQFAMIIGMSIIQFVAIFWFMSRTRITEVVPTDKQVKSLKDYKGQPNLVKMAKQWVDLLGHREEFVAMGGKFPNGLLFYGKPGTGKTYLAECMAGEGKIAFLAIEGSGFRAMFFGVDVLRVMWIFAKARKLARTYGACILFIDEIDAIGMSRGGVMGGQRQMGMMGGMMGGMGGGGALTRLLYEIQGLGNHYTRTEKFINKIRSLFNKTPLEIKWNVLVIGATNRPDSLDPALRRAGRLDKGINVGLPDRSGRREIIEYYLGRVVHDDTINVEAMVNDMAGQTPADIEVIIRQEAPRMAIGNHRNMIAQIDIDDALQERAMGLEEPIEEMSEEEKEILAIHEAGHALLYHLIRPNFNIVRVTIRHRGGALGYVMPSEKSETHVRQVDEWVRAMMVSMAGGAAVEVVTGQQWAGTSSDYQKVITYQLLLAETGYFGPPVYPADKLLMIYEDVVQKFWIDVETQTKNILEHYKDALLALKDELRIHENLQGDAVVAIFENAIGHPTVEEINAFLPKKPVFVPRQRPIVIEQPPREQSADET